MFNRWAYPGGRHPYRTGEWIVYGVLFAGALFFAGDYGITWDTNAHLFYGHAILDYFASGFTDLRCNSWGDIRDKGPLFDVLAAALQRLFGLRPFPFWHWLTSLFGILAVAATIQIGRIWSPRVGIYSGLILLLFPRFFGHSFNNIKDIPFAALFAWTAFLSIRLLLRKKMRVRDLFLLAFVFGLTLSMRVGGVIFLFYFLFFSLWIAAVKKPGFDWWKPLLLATPFLFLVSWAVMIALWPYAHQSPIGNPLRSIMAAKDFARVYPVLFEGRHFLSNDLPWYYLVKYLVIVTPIHLLLLSVVGAVMSLFQWKDRVGSDRSFLCFALFTWLFLPIGYFMWTTPNIYDGCRHVLFVFPAMAVFAGIGLNGVHEKIQKKFRPALAHIVCAGVLLIGLPQLVLLHPYQTAYFNFAGGPREMLHRKYDVGYWADSLKECAEWINERQALSPHPLKVLITANEYSELCFGYYIDDRVQVYRSLDEFIAVALPQFYAPPGRDLSMVRKPRVPETFDYYIALTRYGLDRFFPLTSQAYEVRAGGALLAVIKGQSAGIEGHRAASGK